MDATATSWNVVYADSERFGMRELNALWDGTAACVVQGAQSQHLESVIRQLPGVG